MPSSMYVNTIEEADESDPRCDSETEPVMYV